MPKSKRKRGEVLKPTTVLLPEELRRWHKGQAILDGVSFSEIVRRALETYRLRGRRAMHEDPFMKRLDATFGFSSRKKRSRKRRGSSAPSGRRARSS